MVWFGIFFGIDLQESTGGDATAAAATAPAAPGAELMSGKKGQMSLCMRTVCSGSNMQTI